MTAAREAKGAEAGERESEQTSAEPEIFRLEDMCSLGDGCIAVADHAQGILIYGLGGQLVNHLNSDKDSLAFGVRYDKSRNQLVALILDRPGWTINIYSISRMNQIQLVNQILVPQEPKVERMKLRWLAVTTDGDIYVMAAGLIWKLRNRGTSEWALIHQDERKGAWFSHLTSIPSSTKRFLVCYKGDMVMEATIDKDGFNETSKVVIGPEMVSELGTYTMDDVGNLLISDWSTGDILLLDREYKLKGKVGNAGENEPSFMATFKNIVYVGCKQSLCVKAFRYQDDV